MITLEFILSLFAFLVSIITAFFVFKQSESSKKSVEAVWNDIISDHEYRRRMYAIEITKTWNDKIFTSRSVIIKMWPDRYNQIKPLSWDEIISVRDRQLELLKNKDNNDFLTITNEYYLITDHITRVLNFFENIAQAVFTKVADEEILKENFKGILFHWHNLFCDYINQIRIVRKYNVYSPVSSLYKRWYQNEEEQDIKERCQTGKIYDNELRFK